jgi:prepilin-type N-terminal cleavage/methylation domain-containing protein/prepilin-type processing-associated H-X9-DG protein
MILASCRKRHTGFTLIELLVVIAIIGILAAMLFPVFARARESARKTQCLANVKNIAMGIQIYLTDYDATPPGEHASGEEAVFWATEPGGGSDRDSCFRATNANPHLRWPVIFDEYVKSRDVWRCPSMKVAPTFMSPFFIVPDYDGGWWKYLQNHVGEWGTHKVCSPCGYAYPPGWGGTTTDSIVQQKMASPNAYVWITGAGEASEGSFDPGIGCYEGSSGVKTSSMNDTANYVMCGDNGNQPILGGTDGNLFYPCRQGCGADWSNCTQTSNCSISVDDVDKFANDPSFRAKYSRHMGGSNYGFADGHAKWWPAESWRNVVPKCVCCSPESGGTSSTVYGADKGRYIEGTCFAP